MPGSAPPFRRPLSLLIASLAVVAAALTVPTTAVAAVPPASADGLADLPALQPAMDCANVTALDIDDAVGAHVTLTSAEVVDADPAPYCEVRGTIAPANTIVVRLPIERWTQRYLQTGCGGLCGSANIDYGQSNGCAPVTDGTIATATTDMGHQGQNDGSWASHNPQAQIDFAYRGVHLTALAAKAVITRFYDKAPRYSYFNGCSDGGREGLMEAQRFPSDFDGIAAGAPANNMAVQNTYHHAWNVVANLDDDGNFILLADKLPLIHQAVLDRCDGDDGVTDGVIDDPRRCDFDPAVLHCRAGQDTATCLSRAEIGVVRRLHNGAVDDRGRRLEVAISHEWGSELDWTLFVPASQDQTPLSANFALSYLRYLAKPNHPRPDFQLADLGFTKKAFWRTVMPSSSYMSATDPDLRDYARSGGKLLLWHGWGDQHISPQSTLEYYDAMRRKVGAKTVEQFSRLYMFPGVAHCGGGEGPNTFDVLTPVMAWVETGQRPAAVVAAHVQDGTVTTTRPVYPFPQVARYDGTGSTDDAANFVAYTPKRPVHDDFRWVGRALYSDGYQTWPRVRDGRMVLHGRTGARG
jgi:feruloyl esterase